MKRFEWGNYMTPGYQLYQTLSILKKWHLLLEESHLFHRSFFRHFILVSSWSSFVAVWFKGFDQLWNAEDPHIPRTFTFGSHVMKPTNPEIWNHIKSWLKSCKIPIPIQFMRNLVGFQTILAPQVCFEHSKLATRPDTTLNEGTW